MQSVYECLTHNWETPMWSERLDLSQEELTRLCELAREAEKLHSPTGHFYERNGYYNMFDLFNEDQTMCKFRDIVAARFRDYVWCGFQDPFIWDTPVKVRAFANIYHYGQRIRPHYHHGCDFVSTFYADMGDGAKPDFKTNEAGRFVVIDPRPAQQYPFNNKSKRLQTETGMWHCHPATVWHESETFFSGGERVMISCEFIVMHEHRMAFGDLPFVSSARQPSFVGQRDDSQTLYTTHYV